MSNVPGFSRRGLACRLGTSVTELYRVPDATNTRNGSQLSGLFHLLDCHVQLVVKRGMRPDSPLWLTTA